MTGLLYFIVIAMWGLVFVPIYLKNHDRQQLETELIADEGSIQQPKWRWAHREAPTARQRAFIRRRRVFMLLLTALVATIVAGITGHISLVWAVIPIALNLGFVALAASAAKQQPAVTQRAGFASPSADAGAQVATATETAVVVNRTPQKQQQSSAPRTWKPVESPLPSYVTADRASTFTRGIEADKPWTAQEMLEQAAVLREERAERIRLAQQRLEEARALAMEKARRAALAANQANDVVREQRAVGE